jgi:signal transduction histidine kinase
MKIFKKIFVLSLLFFVQLITAQAEFKVNDNFKSINFKNYISVFSTLDSINPNTLLNNEEINWKPNKVSYGFSNELFWLKFKINNTSKEKKKLYLEVNNPHLRFIEFYELVDNKLILKYKSGRFMHFDTRPVDNVKFLFPIELNINQKNSYYIKIDKRTTSVSFPVNLWEQNEFSRINNEVNLFNGIYFGGVFLAVFYSLIAFFYIRRNLYIYYCLYVVFVGLYMFTSAGYSFQYIAKDSITFNNYFRVITLVLMMFFHNKFVQKLLNTKKHANKLHKFLNVVSIILVSIMLIWILNEQWNITQIYLKITYFLIVLLLIGFLFACFLTYKKMPKIVKLYIFSFSGIILCAILMVVLEYGWFSFLKTNLSPLYVGSIIEIMLLSIVLISEFRNILQTKESLSIEIVEKQQQIVQAYIEGIEKEKLRISEELHDDIGSKLSNLNKFVVNETKFSSKTRNRIEEIINDVRNISHKLSPNNKAIFSFKEQVENIVEEALLNSEINYSLRIVEDFCFLNDSQKLNIYRIIQEFLQNAIKHSQATSIEIELNKLDDNLILTIEDNGVGFNVKEKKNGLGLINIQRRVDYLNGKIEISSILKKGTFILISFPISNEVNI